MPNSYDKVKELLAQAPEIKEILDKIPDVCENLSVSKTEFDFGFDNETGHVIAKPMFVVKTPNGERKIRDPNYVNFSATDFIPGNIKDIALALLNKDKCKAIGRKPIPTFNCKPDFIVNGAYLLSRRIHPFKDYLEEIVVNRFRSNMRDADNLVKNQILSITKTEDFAKESKEALRSRAVEEILDVLKKYGHLGQEVVQEGLDQYLCHTILE